jgi:hypothetical protein
VGLVVNLVFTLLWSVVVFSLLWYAARRFFAVPRQWTFVAGAGTVAFLIGAVFAPIRPDAPRAAPAPSPVVIVTTHNVSLGCREGPSGSIPTNAFGSIDGLVDALHRFPIFARTPVHPNEAVTLLGWAANSDRLSLAAGLCLDVDGRIVTGTPITLGERRADVAAAMKLAFLASSGFEIVVPTSRLTSGKHRLRVIVIDNDGKQTALGPEQHLTLR